MTFSFVYPEVIAEIRAACANHVAGVVSADDLQRTIQCGETIIVAVEENDIRYFLTDIEGQLELIKLTIDCKEQLQKTKEIARQVLSWLRKRERKARINLPSVFFR
ncbi:MAG: hypothetical protein ABF491_13160 [Acetobacter sp.]|uniref:hypothetical protein n=1 Tax=Acetobacter sp. TaxID=440 RepID=UPI0039EB59FC